MEIAAIASQKMPVRNRKEIYFKKKLIDPIEMQRLYPQGDDFIQRLIYCVQQLRYEFHIQHHNESCDCVLRRKLNMSGMPKSDVLKLVESTGTLCSPVDTYLCQNCGQMWEHSGVADSRGPNLSWSFIMVFILHFSIVCKFCIFGTKTEQNS